jgi:hypothetical protein
MQRSPHAPAAHVATEFVPAVHRMPHAPQLNGSLLRFAHEPAHSVVPLPHVALHAPAKHTGVVPPHATPQLPQFVGSIALVPQSAAVLGHRREPLSHPQAPSTHVPFAPHE